jgi:hypothetical protein
METIVLLKWILSWSPGAKTVHGFRIPFPVALSNIEHATYIIFVLIQYIKFKSL